MGDLSLLRKFFRRGSGQGPPHSPADPVPGRGDPANLIHQPTRPSELQPRTNESARPSSSSNTSLLRRAADRPSTAKTTPDATSIDAKNADKQKDRPVTSEGTSTRSFTTPLEGSTVSSQSAVSAACPEFTLEEPTPDNTGEPLSESQKALESIEERSPPVEFSSALDPIEQVQYTSSDRITAMVNRKIWVRRPGASATLVVVREDELVDEAKDTILRKYGNSLGRHYDAPDITLRVLPRDQTVERILRPDENLCQELDKAYPGRQTIEEALIIHNPQKRTPRPSPGGVLHHHHHGTLYHPSDETRPQENGTEYFPPMPPAAVSPGAGILHEARQNFAQSDRSISVLTTGQLPPLASPGGTRRVQQLSHKTRPGFARHSTASPIALTSSKINRPRLDSSASIEKSQPLPPAPLIPTPPIAEVHANGNTPPTPRVSSPRPTKPRKTRQKQLPELPSLVPSFLDTAVPPINVLIVEDNMINMKLLEQFVRRLKVHWATAVNGREAVQKWRQGGFHLVLMDIQLPIMSGLEATREIRRLERVNHIGVLGSSASNVAPDCVEEQEEVKEEDKLGDAGRLFKSPVIIVALTASNLQSDRHEALAAGCNDFLTKPVNFVWFERKVKEWGCMQALIDFDGWRKWKDAAEQNGLKDASMMKPKPAPKKKAVEAPAAPLPKKSLESLKGDELVKEDSPDTVIAVN